MQNQIDQQNEMDSGNNLKNIKQEQPIGMGGNMDRNRMTIETNFDSNL